VILHQAIQRSIAELHIHFPVQLTKRVRQFLATAQRIPAPPHEHESYVLFFDGASRGNPTPASAGITLTAVTDNQARIIWAWSDDDDDDDDNGVLEETTTSESAMTGYTTQIWAWSVHLGLSTNIDAEMQALILGLTRCRADNRASLSSCHILHYLQYRRRPKLPSLRKAYAIAHLLRVGFRQCAWRHHKRIYNPMADAAANWALDSGSTYFFSRPSLVREHLTNDVRPAHQ
ncbi:TPA: hypothetical protein N0F65_003247, partial [Lagenidium giganteum]